MVSVQLNKALFEDEEEKPRNVYRIRKTDYVNIKVKLPPIQQTIIGRGKSRSRGDGASYEEQLLDIERYVKDLLPGISCHPTTLRATLKSPGPLSEADLALWADKDKLLRAFDKKFGCHYPRGYYSRTPSTFLKNVPDFNRDMLLKEVEIKRILESHRPTLLRSLRDIGRFRRKFMFSEDMLEGTNVEEETVLLKSILNSVGRAGSSMGDSAFGEWDGTREETDDYIPSQQTLMTDQERSTILHNLEQDLKIAESESSEHGTSEHDHAITIPVVEQPPPSPIFTETTPPSPIFTEITPISPTPVEVIIKTPSVKITPKPATPPEPPTTTATTEPPKPPTPPQPTPSPEEKKLTPIKIPPKASKTLKLSYKAKPKFDFEASKEAKPTTERKGSLSKTPKTEGADSSVDVLSALSHSSFDLKTDESATESEVEFEVEELSVVSRKTDDIWSVNTLSVELEHESEHDVRHENSDTESMSRGSSGSTSLPLAGTPPNMYEYKPPEPQKTPLPDTPSPSPTPTPPAIPATPPVVKPITPEVKQRKLPPPPRRTGLSFLEEEAMKQKQEEMLLARAQERSREKREQGLMETETGNKKRELQGNEDVNEILERFTIVDKSRLNYLYKIFSNYLPTHNPAAIFLSHQEMKKALSQIKSCTKISRKQLKFIEIVLGLNQDRISFHTFAVMATLIDHMAHKDPATLVMFDSIDLTRMEHDLPRLKRLFHCVSEPDDFGWPKLSTKAMDIELRAACVAEPARQRLIGELDPHSTGEITIFDFIIYTPFWIFLHDGIVENPFRECERVVVSPVHRRWGVSVLWLPEHTQNSRDPPATPASGCGSERSTPGLFMEPPQMRMVKGHDSYSESEENEDSIANSDEDD